MRAPAVVLAEYVGLLTMRSTDALYAEQDDLWALGEQGRQHTYEDFGHHFRVLAALDADIFATHVRYCVDLFDKRGFPQRWLEDAWRIMAHTIDVELPGDVADLATATMTVGLRAAKPNTDAPVLRAELPPRPA